MQTIHDVYYRSLDGHTAEERYIVPRKTSKQFIRVKLSTHSTHIHNIDIL